MSGVRGLLSKSNRDALSQALCKEKGLRASGKKEELIARLEDEAEKLPAKAPGPSGAGEIAGSGEYDDMTYQQLQVQTLTD